MPMQQAHQLGCAAGAATCPRHLSSEEVLYMVAYRCHWCANVSQPRVMHSWCSLDLVCSVTGAK
jgi:hypothetical protein